MYTFPATSGRKPKRVAQAGDLTYHLVLALLTEMFTLLFVNRRRKSNAWLSRAAPDWIDEGSIGVSAVGDICEGPAQPAIIASVMDVLTAQPNVFKIGMFMLHPINVSVLLKKMERGARREPSCQIHPAPREGIGPGTPVQFICTVEEQPEVDGSGQSTPLRGAA